MRPSTLHLRWARRPLAACRAVLLGLLLPAPTDRECPANFKAKARKLVGKRYRGTGVSPVDQGQDPYVTSAEQQRQDLLPVKERTEELLGEVAQRPGIEISLEDFRQLELGLVEKKRTEAELPTKPKKGKMAAPGRPLGEVTFTTLDRIHRAMLMFGLGRSTLLRQVLETEMRQGKRFERLALALNALYPDGSDERRMLEGVQAAMRGVR